MSGGEPAQEGGGCRPKLLVLTSTYPRWSGDAEPGFVHELSRRLLRSFEVTVLCPHAAGAKPFERLDGVEVVRYRYAPEKLEVLVNNGGIVTNLRRHPWAWLLVPGFFAAQAWATWRLLRKIEPSVIHAHWLVPQGLVIALLGALRLRVPPFLVTSHGSDLFALRGGFFSRIKRFVLGRAAAVTVVSDGMRANIESLGCEASKVVVAPMGVDLCGRFYPDDDVQRSPSELLFVGRMVEKKGLRYLIDAMPSILVEFPQALLTVIGFGPEEGERRLQVEQLGISGSVRFEGAMPQEELPKMYRRATVFVAPFVQAASGDCDGLGLVLAEALGCGCPVVTSDIPATREFGPPGPNLRLSRAGDPGALAETVLEALRSSSDEPVPTVERFDWKQRADHYAMLLGGIR